MNIEALRYVQAVFHTKSFSAAARTCGVTQPTLSNAVAKLERELGVKLFDRSPRGVRPTPHGARLLPLIEQILGGLDTLTTQARYLSDSAPRVLRVGVAPLVGPQLVTRVFQAARAIPNPRDLVLREADREPLLADLRAGRLDIALVPASPDLPAFRHQVIARDPLIVINPADPGNNSPVELKAAAAHAAFLRGPRECELTDFISALFERHDLLPPGHAGEADSYRAVDEWAALGVGAALLPRAKITHEHTSCRPLLDGGEPVEFVYEAIWDPASPLAAELKELLSAIHDVDGTPTHPIDSGPA